MSAKNVLVVSAHPDDETLGCGGTLLSHIASGDKVEWLIVTKAWEPLFNAAFLTRRDKQIQMVSTAYGIAAVHQTGFPTTRLDTLPFGEVSAAVSRVVRPITPDVVYIVHPGDVHSDHRVTFDATWAALKPLHGLRATSVYCYETPSSTHLAAPVLDRGFLPNAYRDITGYLDRKLEILDLYEGEVFPSPHPRSAEAVRALARHRGASISVDYAESFCVMRSIL